MWQYFDRFGSIVAKRVELRYPASIFFAQRTVLRATAAWLTGRLYDGQTVLVAERRDAVGQIGQIG